MLCHLSEIYNETISIIESKDYVLSTNNQLSSVSVTTGSTWIMKHCDIVQALVLLEFLILRGSEQCILIVQEDIMSKLSELSSFAYTSPDGKDQGVNVAYR